MKKYFFLGIILLVVFEVANVYFIMPMPGSQEMNSIGIAYFLHSSRWILRGLFGLLALLGISSAWQYSKWITAFSLLIVGTVSYVVHRHMSADTMFLQPHQVRLCHADQNQVSPRRLVMGIECNGEAAAFPIQFLGYHHQVRVTLGGRPFMVTYCTVCRTGRVYEPMVNGEVDDFRLVGMDHYNAMFEDKRSGTWWRQVTGEAIAGKWKGQFLPEWPSWQGTLETWLTLFPSTKIWQPDPAFDEEYAAMDDFESGRKHGTLTRYDEASWEDKSWVVGLEMGDFSQAYDWNMLKEQRIIHDIVGARPVVLVLASDKHSFAVFEREHHEQRFEVRHDTLTDGTKHFDLSGRTLSDGVSSLTRLQAYQEYWHSWKTFHPNTGRYMAK